MMIHLGSHPVFSWRFDPFARGLSAMLTLLLCGLPSHFACMPRHASTSSHPNSFFSSDSACLMHRSAAARRCDDAMRCVDASTASCVCCVSVGLRLRTQFALSREFHRHLRGFFDLAAPGRAGGSPVCSAACPAHSRRTNPTRHRRGCMPTTIALRHRCLDGSDVAGCARHDGSVASVAPVNAHPLSSVANAPRTGPCQFGSPCPPLG
ncbi:hypothetical protein L1887_59619 [Cichorium endivia]|nr:hypothetical protein L1887_59619 [Cichorium endivia]